MTSSSDAPKLFWEIRPYCEEDIQLSRKLLSGELKWGEMILLEKYKAEEPISYLVLFGTLLQIGFGWARPVPIIEDSANQKLDHFALLLVSSFFTNFPYQNILTQKQNPLLGTLNSQALVPSAEDCSSNHALVKSEETRHTSSFTDPTSPPSKIQKKLCSYFASTFEVSASNRSVKPKNCTISTNEESETEFATSIQTQNPHGCHKIFPQSIIHDIQCGEPSPDLMLLDKLVKKFWSTKGQQFFSNNGDHICLLASEIFITMKTPAKNSSFDYDLNKDPKALAIEALGRYNQALSDPNYHRTQRILIDGYVLAVCVQAVEDKTFYSKLKNHYDMPKKRFQNTLHDYNKLVTVWEKRAPLCRMNPKVLKKVIPLKVHETKILATAISLLFSAKMEI